MEPRWSRREFLCGCGVAGITGLTGCLGHSGAATEFPSGDVTVRMTPTPAFEPVRVMITTGETVVWTNDGSRPQSVTAYEDEVPSLRAYFASGGFGREVIARALYPLKGAIYAGEYYAHTFETPGTYGYFSIPAESEGMTGTVVVEG